MVYVDVDYCFKRLTHGIHGWYECIRSGLVLGIALGIGLSDG